MASISRHFLLLAAACGLGGAALAAAPAPETAPARSLDDSLLRAMKDGPTLGFAGRLKLLDPDLRRDFDLPLMTRLVVGPAWRGMTQAEQASLVGAFSDYSVAVYASRFKGYSGETFTVDPAPRRLPSGDAIVHTELVPKGGDPVQLDYLVRARAGEWRIIDVFLNGTISELAARRSEYSATLREGGAEALVALLRKKTAELGG